jgi:tetratricopeptide (TPR) repeat protein
VVAAVLISLVLASHSVAGLSEAGYNQDDLLLQAEAAFAEGVQQAAARPNDARKCFGRAAALFEKLHQVGAANPTLYRNLGNAHILAREPDGPADKSLAQAILAYRRGLLLDPSDGELHRSLEFARQQVVYPPPGTFGLPETDHRPPWLPRRPNVLLAVAVACYILGCLALARWFMVRRRSYLTAAGCLAVLMALFVAAFALELRQLGQEAQHSVVVVARDNVRLLLGNGSGYPALYDTPLNRGVEARLRHPKGRWLQIELSGGQIGWVPRDAVLIDLP